VTISEPGTKSLGIAAHLDPGDAVGAAVMPGALLAWMRGPFRPFDKEWQSAFSRAQRPPAELLPLGRDPATGLRDQPRTPAHLLYVVDPDCPVQQPVAGRDRLDQCLAAMGSSRLCIVDHREQFQVAGAEWDDPVACAEPGMGAAHKRVQPVGVAHLARSDIQIMNTQDDVVDGEFRHQWPCTRVGVTLIGTE
jgi:hypothetical protein